MLLRFDSTATQKRCESNVEAKSRIFDPV